MGKVALFALAAVVALAFAPAPLPREFALLALVPLSGALRWRAACGAAAIAFVAALAVLQIDSRAAARVPPRLDGATLELEARIVSLPDQDPRRARFEIEVEGGPLDGRRLAATWYEARVAPRAAELWRFKAQVRRPRAHLNPGAADIEANWFERGIDGLATVRAGTLTGPAVPGVLTLRAAIAERIAAACPDRPAACAIVAGLAVGRTSGIDEPAWRALRSTGTVHLVAISGLHVTLLGALAAWIAAALARRSVWLTARIPARVVAAVVGLMVACGYALLAGASLPTRRTVLMLAVVAAAAVLRRPARSSSVLAAALLAVLASDPLAVLAPGFWLSFVGVAALVASESALRGGKVGALRSLLDEQAVATLALAPLSLTWFGVLPLIAPLANLFAIPAFNLVLVPFTLLGCVLLPVAPALADAAFRLVALLLDLGIPALGAVGAAGPSIARGAATALALCSASLGTLWLLAPRGVPGRALGALLWLPVLCATAALDDGEFDATVLDVGHGLAVVVATRDHTLVYDTGPRGIDSDAAGWSIQPALAAAGRVPDLVVVSHDDADHAGGAATLQRTFPAAGWLLGTGVPVAGEACAAGQSWEWDGVRFELLHPPRGAAPRGNDGSCVLRVVAAGGSLLLPGDLEAAGEAVLLAHGGALHADALVAPHHGSASSSTAAFIAAVAPRVVVHSVGWRNRWGFPRAAVVARYRAAGAVQWQTAADGAVVIRFRRGRAVEVEAARDAARSWRER